MTVFMAGVALDVVPSIFAQSNPQHDPKKDFPVPFEAQQSPIFYFKRETFQPYVGGIFKVRAGAKTVEMKLERVRGCAPTAQALKVTKKSRSSECFALEFSADRRAHRPDDHLRRRARGARQIHALHD